MGKKFKGIPLLLTGLLTITLVSGCGNKQQATPTDKANSDEVTTSITLPISKDKITLKVFASRGPNEKAYDQMDVFQELEKRTNIHIEWQSPPTANATDIYKVTMASGSIPDIITVMPTADLSKYGKDGTILNLNPYYEKNMPNMKKWMTQFPDIKKSITSLDGNKYFIPTKVFDYLDWNVPLCIRTDWLTKLNLKTPVTPEDWYNVWSAFKSKDPNGNGKADEIPFSVSNASNDGSGVRGFVTAFGVVDNFYTDPKDGGKIHFGPIEDKYKEALTWINKAYKEGLIDRDFITNDEKTYQAKVAENVVGSFRGSVRGNLATFNQTIGPKIAGFHYAGVAPIKNAAGEQIHTSRPINILSGVGTVIAGSCKYPMEAVKLLDYCYSDEGVRIMNFGIENKHYKLVDGKPVYTEYVTKNPDGLSPINATATFSPTAGNQFPSVYAIEAVKQIEDPEVAKVRDVTVGPTKDTTNKYILPPLMFNESDDAVRRQKMTDITTYVNEMIVKFIVGNEPLSNWDTYVKKVNGMGIKDVIPLYQNAIDFYNKN